MLKLQEVISQHRNPSEEGGGAGGSRGVFGAVYASGTQDAKVTKSLLSST